MRVLTVCLGNICRSPVAEAAIRDQAQRRGLDLEVDSAGTGNWHVGETADPRMIRAAASAGLDVTSIGRQVTASDFDEFDVVLAMDRQNQRDLLALAPDDAARERVRLLRSFDPDRDGDDVPDPYYGGADGFVHVVGLVQRAVEGFLDAVERGDVPTRA